jgi:hypothetical protein
MVEETLMPESKKLVRRLNSRTALLVGCVDAGNFTSNWPKDYRTTLALSAKTTRQVSLDEP